MQLSNKNLKCKNHVNISDGVPTNTIGGFGVYGLNAPAAFWLFRFPKLFYHQLICPDNPILHEKSNELYEKYDKHLGDYSKTYQMAKKITYQVHITKKKTLEFLGI